MQGALPLRALVAITAVGNGATCWLVCFRARRGPYSAYILHLGAADSLSLGGTALVLVEEIFKWVPT